MERYHILLDQLGFDSCVAHSGDYISTTGALLTKETLYPALHAMVHKHGALGAQVRLGATPKAAPQFVRLREIDLDAAVQFLADEQVSTDELLRAQLEHSFALGTAAPLWRVTVVNGRTVVFAIHHSIADGQSGPALHAALLSALNSVSADEVGLSSKIVVPSNAAPVESTEAYTSISVSFNGFLHMIYGLLTPKKLQAGARAWSGNPVPRIPSLAMTVRCWEISADQTAEVLRRCREHKTTLTAFLQTLLVGVLSQALLAHKQVGKYKTIVLEAPVSLRRFTGVSPLELCDHVSSLYLKARIEPITDGKAFPWDTACKAGDKLHKRIPKTPQLLGMLRILQRLGSAEDYFKEMLGKKRGCGIGMSNLGRFPVGEKGEGRWRLQSVYFAQSDVMYGAAIKVNVVGSPEGVTSLTFTWGKASVDGDLVATFIKEVKATLDAMLA